VAGCPPDTFAFVDTGAVANLSAAIDGYGTDVWEEADAHKPDEMPVRRGGAGEPSAGDGAGTAPHTAMRQMCPFNYAAVGVVGSVDADGLLGNFGFVCEPYHEGANIRHSAASTVIATGSADTSRLFGHRSESLNQPWFRYMSTALQLENPETRQMALQFCPAGRYLTGLDVGTTPGGTILSVPRLLCASWDVGVGPLSVSTGGRFGDVSTELEYSGCSDGGVITGVEYSAVSGRVDWVAPICRTRL
jgi:hypothetical protein